ncbi:ribonuclease domain-containing protein, partial [Comamonas testosteroni]
AAAVGRKVGVTVLENIGTGPAAGSRTAQRGGVPVGDGANGGVTAVDAAVATGSPITTRFVNGVTVVDQRTGTVFNGTVDLQPTFDRIAAGATGLSRNDGTVFRNLPDRTSGQILLPVKPPGYYTEYVVPTPGINGPGPQRIVTGQGGEMFYTPDHYGTFIPVKKP